MGVCCEKMVHSRQKYASTSFIQSYHHLIHSQVESNPSSFVVLCFLHRSSPKQNGLGFTILCENPCYSVFAFNKSYWNKGISTHQYFPKIILHFARLAYGCHSRLSIIKCSECYKKSYERFRHLLWIITKLINAKVCTV